MEQTTRLTRDFPAGCAVTVILADAFDRPLDYRAPEGGLSAGDIVAAPLGPRRLPGVVWGPGSGELPLERLRLVERLDAALRPEGKAGPLVRTLASHVGYYERWAKTWEFQALLKARPVAGDLALGAGLLAELAPHVHGRPLDAAAIGDILLAKRRIEALVSGNPKDEATASASGRLLLQATIFIRPPSSRPFRAGAAYQGRRGVSIRGAGPTPPGAPS